jgi:hypothetical protein
VLWSPAWELLEESRHLPQEFQEGQHLRGEFPGLSGRVPGVPASWERRNRNTKEKPR